MQRSAFYWIKTFDNEVIPVEGKILQVVEQEFPKDFPPVSAFTSDELIRMLGSVACHLQLHEEKYFHVVYYKDPYDGQMLSAQAPYLPDALAIILTNLLSQKRKPVSEANEWLVAVE